MKVMQINTVADAGSTGRLVRQLADELRRQGHSCLTAYSGGSSSDPDSFRFGRGAGQKCHALLSRLTGLQGHFSHFATASLLRRIAREAPDVVHLHNLHSNNIHLPMLLRFLGSRDIPTVITLHDCWFYTGKCCHYTAQGCGKWQTECGECPLLRADNPSWLFDCTRRLHREKKRLFQAIPRLGVVGVSRWITQEAGRSFLQSAALIEPIYNWVDFSQFYPREVEPSCPDKISALSVASEWSDLKGLGDLLQLAELLEEEMELLLVGALPPQAGPLPQNVRHVERLHSPEELAQAYSEADVYLNLSRQETFGLVSAEALACGTPLVAYRATANPELVGEGCGQVVAARDVQGAAECVRQVRRRGKQAYSPHCLAFAREQFDAQTNLRKQIDFYERLLRTQPLKKQP